MSRLLTVILGFCSLTLLAQDVYHAELLDQLQSEYGLSDGTFLLNDSEQANVNDIAVYGNVTSQTAQVSNANYTLLQSLRVNSAGNNQWDAGYTIRNKTAITSGDVILFTFVARRISTTSEIFLFAEDVSTFEKETYTIINLEPDWNTYYLPVKCNATYGANRMTLGFHLASLAQEFEIAGFTAINYGSTYPIEQFPSSFGIGGYQGSEPDAEWRARAADRIENIRKADMDIVVLDAANQPIEGAVIDVKMTEHEFGFGSALVSCRFPGNNCFNPTYVNKIFDLDGEGHGFNVGVTENALKWDGWEEEWISSPEETVSAIEYLDNQGVQMRGHTLIWPGYTNMPDDISQNSNNLDYVRDRVNSRIESMIQHPVLGELITEWDVLNEITQNRDLEYIFRNDPAYETGREVYQDIFTKVKELNPASQIYVNDYVILSGGGSASSVVNRYITYLDELRDSGLDWEGIGFQCHIGAQPTSINKIEATLDEFYERYGKRVKITEYDISPNVSEEIQAMYMSDFLTMVFSHPSVDAFIMWGFWDNNHWKGNSAMFDADWNLKQSGQAFVDKVFGEWWTEAELQSDSDGAASLRGYKGMYDVTITTPDGETLDTTLILSESEQFVIQASGTVAVTDVESRYSVYPNPVTDILYIERASTTPCEVTIVNLAGQLLHQSTYSTALIKIPVEVPNDSLLMVNITTGSETYSKKVLIKSSY